ncbi:MAG: hypothetical protein QNJ34_15425 [Xenococcaceae cyanobacterium MO_188.B29]|nr:hypothetical protein [Xenococcaceae cyanobacterium MO_188.B29]
MNKIFILKTILTTLISTSIVSSLMALPVRANEDNLVNESNDLELTLSQNFSYRDYRDRSRYPEPTDDFKKIVGITGLAVGTGVIAWHLNRAYKPSLVNSVPTISNHNASLLDRVSPKLRRELLRLVHNQQTANRLLSGTLTSHPGRSPNWLAEKVIYDLKRDRA